MRGRPLPGFYWTGETDMNCLRQCINQTKEEAYAHHIQRLMVTGNFALLAGIDPKEVCEWYLLVYADAYEWVELPNTHGMALFADGGILGSKPYASSGKYIDRMSDYCRHCRYDVRQATGPDACPFNFLYWNFLVENGDALSRNPRMAMMYQEPGSDGRGRVSRRCAIRPRNSSKASLLIDPGAFVYGPDRTSALRDARSSSNDTAAERGTRSRNHHRGAKACSRAQRSRGRMAMKAIASTACDHGIGNSSATHPVRDGTTLRISSRDASLGCSFIPRLARPQWAPPRNDRITAPYATTANVAADATASPASHAIPVRAAKGMTPRAPSQTAMRGKGAVV